MAEYEFISQLGNQKIRKFGSTSLIKDLETGDLFVEKTIDKRKSKKSTWERLSHEANFDFSFQGLPKLQEFNETEDSITIIRPYIEGITLIEYFEKLKRRQQLPFIKELVEKLIPIFEELQSENIVHCDIKPSNILISAKKEDFDVYLIDFGLAIKRNLIDDRKTLFPLGYASPELLLNHLDIVDQRSDLFALGILIWRLFVNELPLRHPNPSIYTNLQLTYPLPDHIELPKGLYSILQKMTCKHQFQLPPNKLSREEVRTSLIAGMNQRYENIKEVPLALNQLKERKSFYQRISFR